MLKVKDIKELRLGSRGTIITGGEWEVEGKVTYKKGDKIILLCETVDEKPPKLETIKYTAKKDGVIYLGQVI